MSKKINPIFFTEGIIDGVKSISDRKSRLNALNFKISVHDANIDDIEEQFEKAKKGLKELLEATHEYISSSKSKLGGASFMNELRNFILKFESSQGLWKFLYFSTKGSSKIVNDSKNEKANDQAIWENYVRTPPKDSQVAHELVSHFSNLPSMLEKNFSEGKRMINIVKQINGDEKSDQKKYLIYFIREFFRGLAAFEHFLAKYKSYHK